MDRTTPSAKGNNWRRPKKRGCKASSRRTTPPSASQLELAERVKFPEKNEDLVISKRHLAERGALLQNASSTVTQALRPDDRRRLRDIRRKHSARFWRERGVGRR